MLRQKHTIFESPFSVKIEAEETQSPDNFLKYQPGFPKTVPTFAIFTKKSEEPGLVTSDHGFEDEPDAERILGGMNMKGPGYAAVARHGSFVMWGFHGDAENFTNTGRRLFLNSIAYAYAHRGEPVESLRLVSHRRNLEDALTFWPSFYKDSEGLRRMLDGSFTGEEIPLELVKNPEAARKWYDERAPWLRQAPGTDYRAAYQLAVDAECKQLGIANNKPEFLHALGARLAKDPADALAILLINRYCPGVAAPDFAVWLATNREKLYFTETGGYVWRVRGTPAASFKLRTEGVEEGDIVRVSAEAGETMLKITLRIRAPWHLYGPEAKDAPGSPVRIRILEGSSFAAAGAIDGEFDKSGELKNYVEMQIPLKRVAPGNKLNLEFTYTACDAQTCRPLKTVKISR